MSTKFTYRQIIRDVHDAVKRCLRVCVISSPSDPVFVTQAADVSGTTIHLVGNATASPVAYPASPGKDITLALIVNRESSPLTKQLDYSLDGGVTYSTLDPGSFVGWPPKGSLKQVFLRRNAGAPTDVAFNIILNRVP